MEAIILAGGFGTRLQSVVKDRPKALSEVAGKHFLEYVIGYLQNHGVNRFVFSLGYLGEQIVEFLESYYPNLDYKVFIETSPLGTGGAIKKVIELTSEADIFIVNADTFFDVDLKAMHQFHLEASADCTISLKEMHNFDRYGCVLVNDTNRITSFKEKSYQNSGLINGGFILLNKKCFLQNSEQLTQVFSFEQDFLEKQLNNILVTGFVSEGYFIDIGIPEDYIKAQDFFKHF